MPQTKHNRSKDYCENHDEAFNCRVAARVTALNCRPKADVTAQAEFDATRHAIAIAYRTGAPLRDMMRRFGLAATAPQAWSEGASGATAGPESSL